MQTMYKPYLSIEKEQIVVSCGCGKNARVDSLSFKRDLADITRLMATGPHYKNWPLKSIERLIVPPVNLTQYKLFRHAKKTVGFVTWAFMSEESSISFDHGTRLLQPSDFSSGDRLWVMDFCVSSEAPKGLPQKMVRYIRNTFKGRQFWWRRANKETKLVRSFHA